MKKACERKQPLETFSEILRVVTQYRQNPTPYLNNSIAPHSSTQFRLSVPPFACEREQGGGVGKLSTELQ